ncbi:3,4-dihydroxy-2-butanone-4-phosphate synthase [Helcobacillus massiliensis]|uniref:3,4-dihydroxy 2-butanone 4-phosphate synthase/GTP cyclohydrolase II n=1 Tax=Helcobacillus massiliensis TaxID=521392 RepID=A0A839QNL4_9MICO|nr:3,4-dihydroxy-2-butanone-4-phosphate synthase [Helcobacillus massiliensis]MBB3022073.1 3,4-dihydroxy 2-butanone 4-phosphate synthase/GTP cyclohydrolase II [Helcobacillus massiliensis]
MTLRLTPLPDALDQLRAGRPVVVLDDEDRENEGDLILAAELATEEQIGFMVRHTSGYLCAPITPGRARRLGLPLMVPNSEDPKLTAYTLTVDARHGTTTGISAHDRALTARTLVTGEASDLIRPGHLVPLIARPGGLRERPGHTEAATDLARLAGLRPAGVIGEIVHDDGSMMRAPALAAFAAEHGLAIITIEQILASGLLEELDGHAASVGRPQSADGADDPDGAADGRGEGADDCSDGIAASDPIDLPTPHGTFTARAWQTERGEHLTLTADGPDRISAPGADGSPSATVRLHSECLTGDVFGSHRCDCGEQLDAALTAIARDGGTLLYLRGHEGRGIGLFNKLRAYALQDRGADTVDANRDLGLPVDARLYTDAAGILRRLGLTEVDLITNNPVKAAALEADGIRVRSIRSAEVPARAENTRYLATKRDRMHHMLTAI